MCELSFGLYKDIPIYADTCTLRQTSAYTARSQYTSTCTPEGSTGGGSSPNYEDLKFQIYFQIPDYPWNGGVSARRFSAQANLHSYRDLEHTKGEPAQTNSDH